MPSFTDPLGRVIEYPVPPQRIVSLVPSQTELLYDLGLDNSVIGITKFCVHPNEWFRNKTRVGGTKSLKMDIIRKLQPDLIIANKEENQREQVEALATDYPVWMSDVHTLDDALQMIDTIGKLTFSQNKAAIIIEKINKEFEALLIIPHYIPTAYLIWRQPYMAAGGDTFINDMLLRCGLQNIFKTLPRYPEITIEQLQTGNCRLVLLSSEPYPFNQKHLDDLQQQLPHTTIRLVNGELFSWYGSRLMQSPAYFRELNDRWRMADDGWRITDCE